MSEGLDGNAIAGLLADVFETELTTATGHCRSCGTHGPLAETAVYLRAPGTVVRCRTCSGVLMVFVAVRGTTCVDLRGLTALESGAG